MCPARVRYPFDRIAAAYPCVHQSWIFCVLEKTELPEFICRFLKDVPRQHHARGICRNDSRSVLRGQGSQTRMSSERLLVCDGLRPYIRWLQDATIPRNPGGLDFPQTAQCAYADDLAVAASSFWDLMTALAPAFHSVDHIAGLKKNYRKCC